MQFFLISIASIIIITGIITMFYLIYNSLINMIHPNLARLWFGLSLLIIIFSLCADILVYRYQVAASKSVFESEKNFAQPFSLMEIK